MSSEVFAAFIVAALWALAGASSLSRPRLRLGNYFVLTCWLLATASAAGATLAMTVDESWPATWLVAALSSVVLLVRVHTSGSATIDASSEGRSALAILGVGLAGATGITLAALVTRAVLAWPDQVGLLAVASLGGVAALTTLVHTLAPKRGRRAAIWLLGGLGSAIATSGLSISFAHALVGDVDDGRMSPGESFLGAMAAALVMLTVVPAALKRVASRVSDGRHGQRDALLEVDAAVEGRLPLEETLLQTCEVLRSSLQLEGAEVWTSTEDEVHLSASDPHGAPRAVALSGNARSVAAGASGSTDGDWVNTWLPGLIDQQGAVAAAVTYAGDFQGLIIAYGAQNPEHASSMLSEVSSRLGPVMHSASLDASLRESVHTLRKREEALRASRERLVAAADNERARIERDLHDGVQQHLVALGVNLQLAQGLLDSDPSRAHQIMSDLTAQARSAVEELRSLSRGIFPKTLEDEGIGPALDEFANQRVKVTTSGTRRFTREIETAVYFVCTEAITNALKHADPDSVSVHLVGGSDALVFEVVDDGCGFDVTIESTHGLSNMADRIGAVDGLLDITSNSRGTRLLGTVPLT